MASACFSEIDPLNCGIVYSLHFDCVNLSEVATIGFRSFSYRGRFAPCSDCRNLPSFWTPIQVECVLGCCCAHAYLLQTVVYQTTVSSPLSAVKRYSSFIFCPLNLLIPPALGALALSVNVLPPVSVPVISGIGNGGLTRHVLTRPSFDLIYQSLCPIKPPVSRWQLTSTGSPAPQSAFGGGGRSGVRPPDFLGISYDCLLDNSVIITV